MKSFAGNSAALAWVSLLADVVLFFHKPLFSSEYQFPWDFRGVQLPLLTFLSDRLRAGHFALWNPYSYCGYPVFANIEACFFHPLVLAGAWIASVTSPDSLPLLLEWIVVLQVWIAGVSAYYLFQELGAGRVSSWAGAIIFETGGYFASRAEHIGAMMAVAWMPLAWLAVCKLRHGWRPGWQAALAAALGMAVLGGFPQPTVAVFVSTALLPLVLLALRMARPRVVFDTACAFVLGIALSAVILIPAAQLTGHSVAKYRSGWLGRGGGLLWQSLVSLVLPNHYHIFDLSHFKGPGELTFLYLYCSIGGLLLAIFALVKSRRRPVALLAVMSVFGITWMLGQNTPLWNLIYPYLPEQIRIVIHPEYTYCIPILAIAGLAAFGLDALPVNGKMRVAIGLAIAADLFLVGSGRPMNCSSRRTDPGATRYSFDGSAAALAEMRQLTNQAYPPWRVDNFAESTGEWAVQAPITGVPSANGVSPMALENIIQLRLFLHDGEPWGWYYPVEKPESQVLDLLNVRYLVTTVKSAGRIYPLPRYRHVSNLAGNELFENLTAMPRFFQVHDARAVTSLTQARALIGRPDIDLRRTAITEEAVALSPAPGSGASEEVKTVDYQPDSLELAARSSGASLLVLSENYYPGWEAWLDGKPVPILRADIALRAVVVPDGSHRVRMEFRPAILTVGLMVSLATALGLIALAFCKPR